jgi:hypothetical protein
MMLCHSNAESAAHDLKGDALHTLWGAEEMLLAGAAQYEGGEIRKRPPWYAHAGGAFARSFRVGKQQDTDSLAPASVMVNQSCVAWQGIGPPRSRGRMLLAGAHDTAS